jgi:hypothetical protein
MHFSGLLSGWFAPLKLLALIVHYFAEHVALSLLLVELTQCVGSFQTYSRILELNSHKIHSPGARMQPRLEQSHLVSFIYNRTKSHRFAVKIKFV